MIMISLTEFLVFTAAFLVSFLIVRTRSGKKNDGRRYPPSLPRLPIVGSLPFMRDFDNLAEIFMKKSSELGPVFTFQIGSRSVLVLNTFEAIEDALVKHATSFSGRKRFLVEKYCNPEKKGIMSMNHNAEFRKYRKLWQSVLKEFGFGSRSKSEHLIFKEVAELVDNIKKFNGKDFDPAEMVMLSATNVPFNMLTGRRRTFDEGLSELCLTIEKTTKLLEPALDVFPVLRFLPYYCKKFQDMKTWMWKVYALINTELQKTLQDETSDTFVHRYIKKAGPGYDHDQLVYTVRDLIGASIETTSTVLLWVFIYLSNNPSVAERIQKEIDAVVPRDRLPSTDDQSNLPLTEATILEILRIRTVSPVAIPHLTLQDTEVLGFFVPARTMVLPNIFSANMNQTNWSEPEIFRPERFLDKSNKLINKNRVISFSLGWRSCPGEALARHQLFLFISGLLQNFSFQPPEGVNSISDKIVHGTVERPFPFTMRMIPRRR